MSGFTISQVNLCVSRSSTEQVIRVLRHVAGNSILASHVCVCVRIDKYGGPATVRQAQYQTTVFESIVDKCFFRFFSILCHTGDTFFWSSSGTESASTVVSMISLMLLKRLLSWDRLRPLVSGRQKNTKAQARRQLEKLQAKKPETPIRSRILG